MGVLELPEQFGKDWEEPRERVAPVEQMKFALSDIADEWHFFNHGAFFSFAGFDYPAQDPVGDWYAKQPFGTKVMMQPFTAPVFDGIDGPVMKGKLTWDNVVCGVREESWPSLFEFLGGICSIDDKKKLFFRTFAGDVNILDPILVEKDSALNPAIPRIRVTVFCVDGNENRWEIRPPLSPIGPPRMVKMAARQEIIQAADKIFSGDMSPLTENANPAMQAHLDKFRETLERGPIILDPNDGSTHPTGNA